MRVVFAVALFLTLAASGAQANDGRPSQGLIIAMAQQLVAKAMTHREERQFAISFDVAYLHPQPDPDFWAVVGGIALEHAPKRYKQHTYVAAVRLICARPKDMTCWQLEKLAIDDRILINEPPRRRL